MVIQLETIKEVLRFFGLDSVGCTAEKINTGHINQTYKVVFDGREYILQRLNPSVFSCPEKVMDNIGQVCGCTENSLHFLTCNGRNFLEYDGAVWRIYEYVRNSVSYDALEDDRLIHGFGSILGRFHRDTADLDPSLFYVTIEDFHNTRKRIEKLLSSGSGYTDEFKMLLTFADRLAEKKLPLKVTHNDVKCSNVLFDKDTGKALALIDLDTVMPGYCAYDIGDGIRSSCVSDESIDTEKLKAFCRGYFSVMQYAPSAEDIFLGTLCVTAELSARYLYDALSGENYFADKTREQKIIRGEQLLKIALLTAENENDIIKTIGDCA